MYHRIPTFDPYDPMLTESVNDQLLTLLEFQLVFLSPVEMV